MTICRYLLPLSLLFAAPAQAATFCVGSVPDCPAGATAVTTFAAAADGANANAGQADTILLGPGTFTATTGDSHEVAGGVVTIRGAGAGQTILRGSQLGSPLSFFGDPGSSVRGITFEPVASSGFGIVAREVAVRDSEVRGLNGTQTAILAHGSSTIERVTISEANGTTSATIGLQIQGTSVVRDLIATAATPLSMLGTELTLERARLDGRTTGAQLFRGNSTVEGLLVRVPGSTPSGMRVGSADNSTGPMSVVVRGMTLVKEGGATGDALNVTGGQMGSPTHLTVEDSVLRGFPVGVRVPPGGAAAATVALTRSQVQGAFHGTTPTETSPIDPSLDPGFLVDYRLTGGSPLIDAGGPASAQQDVAGVARDVDGDGDGTAERDAGAFEYRRQAPVITATAAAASVQTGTALDFAAVASDPDGEPVSIGWLFGDGGTATGASVSHAFATAGSRDVVATATDPAGLSASATVPVTVTSPGGAPGPDPGPATPVTPAAPVTPVTPITPITPRVVEPTAITLRPRSTRSGRRRRVVVRGVVTLPPGVAPDACAGVPVTLTLSRAGRRVARRRSTLDAACRYSFTVGVRASHRKRRLSVLVATTATDEMSPIRRRASVRVAS